MSMFKSTDFTFDGVASSTYNVIIVDINRTGIENFDYGLSNTSIIEEKIPRRERPYHYGVDSSPMSTDFVIIKEDGSEFSQTELFNIKKWLMHRQYKKFVSDDNTGIYYNVILTDPEKVLIGKNKIGLSFRMRMDAPYGYLTEQTDSYTITGSQAITIDTTVSNYDKNYSNVEIQFTVAVGTTDITIENTDDDGRIVEFSTLTDGEVFYMNNQRKELFDDNGDDRFDVFNLTWFRLLPNEVNNITITGSCDIEFRYSLPILI